MLHLEMFILQSLTLCTLTNCVSLLGPYSPRRNFSPEYQKNAFKYVNDINPLGDGLVLGPISRMKAVSIHLKI